MRNYIYIILTFFISVYCSQVAAYTGECVTTSGTTTITADIGDLNINSASGNDVGKIVTKDLAYTASGLPYKASCDIDKKDKTNIYMTTTVPLPKEDDGWYTLNDYLSVKTETWIDAGRKVYIVNPFESESNNYRQRNGEVTNWKTGGKGRLSIRIDRKFIGFSPFNKKVLIGYGNAYETGVSSKPLFELYIKGSVIVPQSCELDAGQTINMDFGNIGAPLFTAAGAGNKPDGVNPQTHTIAIKCKNIDAQALLTMRVETGDVSGNALVSDNPDVGFIIADGNKTPLTPNNINSRIPFTLDDNSAAQVPITAWPVSITGNKPAEGQFTAEGYLRIDFD